MDKDVLVTVSDFHDNRGLVAQVVHVEGEDRVSVSWAEPHPLRPVLEPVYGTRPGLRSFARLANDRGLVEEVTKCGRMGWLEFLYLEAGLWSMKVNPNLRRGFADLVGAEEVDRLISRLSLVSVKIIRGTGETSTCVCGKTLTAEVHTFRDVLDGDKYTIGSCCSKSLEKQKEILGAIKSTLLLPNVYKQGFPVRNKLDDFMDSGITNHPLFSKEVAEYAKEKLSKRTGDYRTRDTMLRNLLADLYAEAVRAFKLPATPGGGEEELLSMDW